MTQYYVTLTWHNWPEGGSYGTIVEAPHALAAEDHARLEMQQTYEEQYDTSAEDIRNEWYLVDCFDVSEFIKEHTKTLSAEELQRLEEDYPVNMWKRAVALDATTLGYTEWIKERKR